MVKLIWTDQALDDLADIGDYIAENSEKYAKLLENYLKGLTS
jgi:plasmid stabilization system protein ParE